MQQSIRDILVGLTVIVGLAGVATLLILFGELSLGAPERYPIHLRLNTASGLNTAAKVTLDGVVIGAVGAISPPPPGQSGAVVTVNVLDGVQIPANVDVVIERGLIGEATLLLRTKAAAPGETVAMLAPGSTLEAKASGILEELVGAMDERLKPLLNAGDTFTKLADQYIKVGEQLSAMLEPRTIADVEAGADATLPSTLARLDLTIADARAWLTDPKLREDVPSALARLDELLGSASQAVQQWSQTAQTLSNRVDQVGADASEALTAFASATRALDESLAELRVISARINQGEGTLGQLVNNPDLYRSLNDAAIRMERALTEAQLLIEKYRREGVPIQF